MQETDARGPSGHQAKEDATLAVLRDAVVHPIIANFPQGAIVVFDSDLRYLTAGGLGLAAVGLTSSTLVGRTIFEAFDPEVAADIEPLYRRALAGEETSVDVACQGRVFLQRLSPVRTPSGQVVAGMGVTQDVTESRASMAALVESEERLREESRRLREAQELGRMGSWDWDPATDTVSWSDTLQVLHGVDHDTFGGDLAATLRPIHPDDRPRVEEAIEACRTTATPILARYRVAQEGDGDVRWFDMRGQAVLESGRIVRLAGVTADVTDLVKALEEGKAAQKFFDAVLAATPDYTFVSDLPSGQVVYSSTDRDILGHRGDQMAALTPEQIASLVHEDDHQKVRGARDAKSGLADGEVLQTRYRARHADGGWRWLSRRVTPFSRDARGALTQILGVVRDVTDVVKAEERLTHAALHDSLTGLPNRALLIDRLQSALERSRRDDRTVAVLFCDLDGFKRVNDTGGHAAGDAVLLETARRLASAVRPTDTVARVGGDEFVILVEPWKRGSATNEAPSQARSEAVSDRDLAVQVASRITEAVSQPITVQGVDYVVTVSIGLSYSGGGEGLTGSELTADDFLQNADTAMYRAKGRGKDRLEVFEHTLRSELAERGRVERVLRRALRDHVDTQPVRGVSPSAASPVIYPAYQPVYDSRSGRLASFEVLARLTDADGSDIRPDVFVAVAEDVGLIQPLGKLMLHLACKQLVEWRAATPAAGDLTMAVNVSALQASHGSLGRDVTEALELHGLTPSDLILELTETAFLRASHSTLAALRELRSAGVGIAIDDFGTGYASLRYLATLPVSELKVDKSFTAGLPHDLTNRKIVHAVAGLAADLDLVCVVEGVETEEQRAALPPGVHLQGWLTGRPQCAGLIDLASLLRTSIPARRA